MTYAILRPGLMAATSLLACLASPAANAQTSTAQAAAPDDASDGGVGEIIVTAQKKSESLQRVPAAVTALSQETLIQSGITNLWDAQNFVPSVRLNKQASTVQLFVRGIGQTYGVANTEENVAFNFNGIYVYRELASMPMFDMARIEVLPGPQGTLYGRSALGGAINVVTQRPTQDLETSGVLEVGNYDLVHVTAAQNLPLSDQVSLRGAVDYTNRGGYMTSGAGADDTISGRLSALLKPTDNFTAFVFGQFMDRRGTGMSLVNKGFNPKTFQIDGTSFMHGDPWDDTLPDAFTAVSGPVRAYPKRIDGTIIGGQLDWDLGPVTVTFVPGYAHIKGRDEFNITALDVHSGFGTDQYSGELRLSGTANKLDWMLGLNLYHQKNYTLSDIDLGPVQINGYQTYNRSKGLGLFTNLTYHLTDQFRLLLGGRYSDDSRSGNGLAADTAGQPTIPWAASTSSNHFDWKAGVEYDLAPAVMVYATGQSGYQPATYNATNSTPTFNNLVKAPTIIAGTGGIKSQIFDRKLQLNVEGFYYRYKNFILNTFDTRAQLNAIFNADLMIIYGLQTDLAFRPTQNDNLNVSVGYLHARQTKAITPDGVDVSGLQNQLAPDWTISASYAHDFKFKSGYLRAAVDTRYESSFFGDYFHNIGTQQKAYFMSNASLTFNSNNKWSLGIWIKNIENEAVVAAIAGGIPGPAAGLIQAPRTYGLRFTVGY